MLCYCYDHLTTELDKRFNKQLSETNSAVISSQISIALGIACYIIDNWYLWAVSAKFFDTYIVRSQDKKCRQSCLLVTYWARNFDSVITRREEVRVPLTLVDFNLSLGVYSKTAVDFGECRWYGASQPVASASTANILTEEQKVMKDTYSICLFPSLLTIVIAFLLWFPTNTNLVTFLVIGVHVVLVVIMVNDLLVSKMLNIAPVSSWFRPNYLADNPLTLVLLLALNLVNGVAAAVVFLLANSVGMLAVPELVLFNTLCLCLNLYQSCISSHKDEYRSLWADRVNWILTVICTVLLTIPMFDVESVFCCLEAVGFDLFSCFLAIILLYFIGLRQTRNFKKHSSKIDLGKPKKIANRSCCWSCFGNIRRFGSYFRCWPLDCGLPVTIPIFYESWKQIYYYIVFAGRHEVKAHESLATVWMWL